jgi:hypothetical protein
VVAATGSVVLTIGQRCEEIMSYRSSSSTRMDGYCSNRVDIAGIYDKIIEIEIVKFRYNIVKLKYDIPVFCAPLIG